MVKSGKFFSKDVILGHQFDKKNSSLLLHAIHTLFYWWISQKTILFSGCKNPHEKSAKQENSSLFMNSIL